MLDEQTVHNIRHLYADHTMEEIAYHYNISKRTVNQVIQNRPDSPYYSESYNKPDKKSGEANPAAKLTNLQREYICKALEQKERDRGLVTKLANQFGVSRMCIYKILRKVRSHDKD